MPNIKDLAEQWLRAKERIKEEQEALAAIEAEMLPLLESVEGGTKTNHCDGFKVVVKRPINRTIDGDDWERVKQNIPVGLWPVRVKVEPDPKGCDWMAENRPDLWATAAEAITERPGKPGFTIEEEEEIF